DATVARAHAALRHGDHRHRLFPAVRRALRDDPRGAVEPHAEHRALDVRAGLSLVEHGLRCGRRLRSLRHHPRPHALAEEAGVRVAVVTAGASLALVAGVLPTLSPLLWMVSASLMPPGEATAVPPRLLPSRFTLEHYRDLFTRMHVVRHVAASVVVSTAT